MRTDHITLKKLELSDAPALLALRLRNRAFFQPFEPIRPDSFLTLEGQEKDIAAGNHAADHDQGYTFGIFLTETDELIGRVALTGVARGPFQNANLGYFMDQAHNGRGYMTEAVQLVTRFAFGQAGLHRIQAGVMPRNVGSIRVLEKAGFRREGLALNYLKINGVWEDHALFAITADHDGQP